MNVVDQFNEVRAQVQLIALVKPDDLVEEWVEWLSRESLDQFSAVDVAYLGTDKQLLGSYGNLMRRKHFFLHACLGDDVERQLNYLVRKDCDFFAVVEKPDDLFDVLPEKMNKFFETEPYLIMIEPTTQYHGLVCNTTLCRYLCGWGQQSLPEKIKIHLTNHDSLSMMYKDIYEFSAKIA